MQTDLPWNVAGIPPEAREAARAAARREGLSVGEWLTRRILRSLTEGGEPNGWHRNPDLDYRDFRGPQEHQAAFDESSSRDTDEMLARVSRSETKTNSAYRRIEDQLGTLAKRIEDAEKSQTENTKAMSQAATEINTAAREQSQAFDQLGAHVMGLGDRIARVERGSANDGVKDAVKGLHAGLSRLADQIADNSNQSATQIAALAGNVDSVVGKINDVRNDAENAARTLSSRIAGFDERVRTTEASSHAIADRLDKTIVGIEVVRGARTDDQSEIHRQAQVIAQLSEALDKLATRISASETQTAGVMERLEHQFATSEARTSGAMARLEQQIVSSDAQTSGAMARLEQQIADSRQVDQPFDRRLQGIEQALADIVSRLEGSASASRTVEDNLRDVSSRLDAADKRHRDAIMELRASVSPQAAPPQVTAAPTPPAAGTILDLPPFPDTAPSFASPSFASPEAPPFAGAPSFAGDMPFGTDPLLLTQPAPTETADSYIAAARRSARAAATAEAPPTGFTWGAAPLQASQKAPKKSATAPYVLAAGIFGLVVAAVVAGVFLSHGLIGNTNAPMQVVHPQGVAPAVQVAPQTTQPAPVTNAPSTIPGSPVIPKRVAPAPKKAASRTLPALAQQTVAPVQAPKRIPSQSQAARPMSALDHLTALASQGNAKAELLVGLKYLDGDGAPVNEAEAAKWLQRAANQGEAIAAYRLGTLYERGHGVPVDAAKSIQWYQQAAKLGNRKAMHNLAVAYAEGTGTPKDLNQAAQWFSRAAALGLADSQFNLAVLYERGMGVQQSLIDAYKWYAIAASQGDSESKARLDVLSTQLNGDERAAAQKAAAEFRPQPLDRNANVPPDPSVVG